MRLFEFSPVENPRPAAGWTKLTDEQILEIAEMRAGGTGYRAIAAKFDRTQGGVMTMLVRKLGQKRFEDINAKAKMAKQKSKMRPCESCGSETANIKYCCRTCQGDGRVNKDGMNLAYELMDKGLTPRQIASQAGISLMSFYRYKAQRQENSENSNGNS